MEKNHPDQESVFRALFEKSPEGLVHCDPDTRILMVNDQFCLMFGYEREEIVGKRLEEVVVKSAHLLEEAKKLDEEYLHSGNIQIETTRQKKDGTTFPVSIFASPVLSEGVQAGSLYIYRDMTEQQDRSEALRISEAKLRGILESHPELIMRFTPDLVTTYANRTYCDYHGISYEEAVGRSFTDNIPAEDIPLVRAKMLALTPENSTAKGEERVVMASGKIRWQEWTDQGIFDENGKLIEIQSVGRDITDHKRLEQEISISEAKLRGILESHPELIMRFTPDLVTTYANKAYCNYHGIACEDAVGRPFTDNIDPEDIPLVHAKLLALTPENNTAKGEEKVVMASGEIRWQEWTDQGIFDENGKLVEIQSVGRDITDRKKLEAELAFEREALDLLFKNAGEGIVLCDEDGTIIRANPMFCRMFGYSMEELVRRDIDNLVAPDSDQNREARTITQVVSNGRNITVETSRQRKDRSLIEVSILGVPVRMSEGSNYAYAIYRDITDYKRKEEELLRLNRELFISATTDKLTGLLNRHYFEDIIQREIARSSRYGTPLSLVMIDLDNFKKLNDTRGHLAGDRALETIARTISENIRTSDTAARWGGDEFVLASPTTLEQTAAMAEKLRHLFHSLSHDGFNPISASFGISSWREGDTIDSLTRRADESMYEAKGCGGNSVRYK